MMLPKQNALLKESESELLILRLKSILAILLSMYALEIWVLKQEAKEQLCVLTKSLQLLLLSLSMVLCSKENSALQQIAFLPSPNSQLELSSEQAALNSNMPIKTSLSISTSSASTTLSLEQWASSTCGQCRFQIIMQLLMETTWVLIKRFLMILLLKLRILAQLTCLIAILTSLILRK